MPANLYEAACIFLLYAFLGWVCEVAFAALEKGEFVNRGFLNGPVCPIYGFGMLAVILMLWPLRKNVFLLFVGASLLTTAIEFVTGFVLEKVFHDKWWDYSDMPFHIGGYVCLKFTVIWGLSASFVIGAVHPVLYLLIEKTPFYLGLALLLSGFAVFSADLIITIIALAKLPKKLNAMLELEKSLRVLSDKIGENVSEVTLAAAEKSSELIEGNKGKLADLKAEYAKKLAEYRKIVQNANAVHKRIFKAFPKLKKGKYRQIFERLYSLKERKREDKHEIDQL